MSQLLDITGLTLRADDTTLVSNLSFSMAPGERLGLIGESGSGKSLTAMATTGLLPTSIKASGSIVLGGQEVVGASERGDPHRAHSTTKRAEVLDLRLPQLAELARLQRPEPERPE